ncbi:Protein containing adaptin N-terminal region [Forsythia ovata]|uniref:Protein containing adaptin N-terminal region n=1 Tax=Forsythia ovata TaxID=205694 RepID=A0ABD1PHU5_9LAMI
MVLQYLEDGQISEVLKELTDSASSSSWTTKHGSVRAISSILRHNPAIIYASPLFTVIVNSIKSTLKDEKVSGEENKGKRKTAASPVEQENRKKVLKELNSLISGPQSSFDDAVGSFSSSCTGKNLHSRFLERESACIPNFGFNGKNG